MDEEGVGREGIHKSVSKVWKTLTNIWVIEIRLEYEMMNTD